MKHFIIAGFVLLAHFCSSQELLTPELLWKMNRISGGTVSPDGQFLLYSQRSYDLEANKGNTDLFVLDLKRNKTQQITATPFTEMEAQWGINNTIWFMSAENEGLQIWKMNADGKEKKQCSHFKDVELEGFKVAPDEKSIVAIEAIKVKQTISDKYPDLTKANARIEDNLMYRHWDHFDDYMRRHLFLHKIVIASEGEAIALSGTDLLKGEHYDGILPPMGGSEQFCYSNDSKKIIYTSKKLQGKDFALSTNSELYEYDILSGTTKNLTLGNKGYDMNPSFSSKGTLAWQSMPRDGFESDKNHLKIMATDGKIVDLTKELDITIGSFCWHPNGDLIYFIAPKNGTEQLFELNVTSGKTRQLTSGQFDFVSISVYGETIYAGRQSMVEPTELFSYTIKKNK